MEFGGCAQKYVSTDSTNTANRFESEKECESYCVKPQGSGKCYLANSAGSCNNYAKQMFYYDPKWKKCMEFTYGGCLGNMNRFETIQECQESCLRTDGVVAICAQPYEPGPCR